MEAVEEPPIPITAVEGVKVDIVSCEVSAEDEALVQSDVCQKSNGVAELTESVQVQAPIQVSVAPDEPQPSEKIIEVENSTEKNDIQPETTTTEIAEKVTTTDGTTEDITPTKADKQDDIPKNDECGDMQAGEVEVDGIVESTTENVLFETEILIETNVDEPSGKYKIIYSDNDATDQTNNILCELGQNIELSEVLRSSDVTENVENNNAEIRQEVFNKEELLDILEGNDVEESRKVISENFQSECKKLETQLALQQLSRLQHAKRTRTNSKKIEKRSSKKSDSPRDENVKKKSTPKDEQNSQTNSETAIEPKEESIVNALVKDWEDDEPNEGDQSDKVIEESEKILKETDKLEVAQNTIIESNVSKASVTDVSINDGKTPNSNKISTDTQPQRRLGRVIKKKVIFDPDNPDTFTKTKVTIKKENPPEKEQPTPKKIKIDSTPRSKSKSPVQTKLQWKKPQPKNNKKFRPTEIDKLLMDEGAVNMICQLTPEAPQGNKNMKSKAEFIKKIQSSTPVSKEMKFRERKKELKCEDGEPKKIGSAKERLSLTSSVKSPAVSEDFEAHSADDSIIYRRHSSSSYSSSCMSPRRLSDVESINQSAISSQTVTDQTQKQVAGNTVSADVFMAGSEGASQTGVINKKNLMSIKEKLNSKLTLALNKRKRESSKGEKPSKIKKVTKLPEKPVEAIEDYKYLRLTGDKGLIEICILDKGDIYNIEVMKELKGVLEAVDSCTDVSVTLLTSELGNICSGLDLKPLLDQENGSTYAQDLAESARSLLCTLEAHSKLVCTAVGDGCVGLGLSMVALSDITLASDRATFEMSPFKDDPIQPGAAALIACGLPQHLLSELIVFDRCISASDALRGGLVTQTIWPENYLNQVRTIAKDLAAQPQQNIMLKKQLLRLKRGVSGSFLSDLEKERDLFVKFWTSASGRALVRESLLPGA